MAKAPEGVLQPETSTDSPANEKTRLKRYPLEYSPESSTQVNVSRLPKQNDLAGMELAFREEPQTEEELQREVRTEIILFAVGGSLGAFFIHLIGAIIPFLPLFILSVVVGVITAAMMYGGAFAFSYRRALVALLAPPLFIIVTTVVSQRLLSLRSLASLSLGAVSVGLMLWTNGKRHPIYFYREWIFTAWWLKPETRRVRRKIIAGSGVESLGWFIVSAVSAVIVLFIVVVLPAYSPTVAIVALIIVALIFSGNFRFLQTWQKAINILAHYLTYGKRSSGAAGVWIPECSAKERRWAIANAVFFFYLSLSTGLCLYFPADLVELEPTVQRAQSQTIGDRSEKRTPEAIKATLQKRLDLTPVYKTFDEKGLGETVSLVTRAMETRNTDTHAGIRLLLSSMWKTLTINLRLIVVFFVLPFALAVILPNLLLLGIFRHHILRNEALREQVNHLDRDARTEWQCYIDRIQKSEHTAKEPLGRTVREKDHVFLGVEPKLRFPVLVDKKLFSEHSYIVGQSGSGKTSLGVMPLFLQLNTKEDKHPVVIIDLKGDPALFHTAKAHAEACGQEFKFFSPEAGKKSFYFNPFKSFESEHRTPMQLVNLVLDSLSLNHGEGYGRSFYSRQSRLLLFDALHHKSNPRTFKELLNTIEIMSRQGYKDTFELLSTVHALAKYKFLTDPEQNIPQEDVIHFPEVIEKSQICYFWLPAAVESISVREIGKLALYSLLTAAIDRQRAGRNADENFRQTYLFIDEFQRISGENFRIVLEQARSFGVGVILANQTLSDLKTADFDLRPTVRTNTRLQMFFSVSDTSEVEMLSDMSGQEIVLLKNINTEPMIHVKWWVRFTARRDGVMEHISNRLGVNDIARISDHPLDFVVNISRGEGYAQFAGLPIPVRTHWPIDQATYKNRSETRLPDDLDAAESAELAAKVNETGGEKKATKKRAQKEKTKTPKVIETEARTELAQMIDKEIGEVFDDIGERGL
jgi:hypothetical protein